MAANFLQMNLTIFLWYAWSLVNSIPFDPALSRLVSALKLLIGSLFIIRWQFIIEVSDGIVRVESNIFTPIGALIYVGLSTSIIHGVELFINNLCWEIVHLCRNWTIILQPGTASWANGLRGPSALARVTIWRASSIALVPY